MHIVLVWALFFVGSNTARPIYFGTQTDCVEAKSAIESEAAARMSPCIRMKVASVDQP